MAVHAPTFYVGDGAGMLKVGRDLVWTGQQ